MMRIASGPPAQLRETTPASAPFRAFVAACLTYDAHRRPSTSHLLRSDAWVGAASSEGLATLVQALADGGASTPTALAPLAERELAGVTYGGVDGDGQQRSEAGDLPHVDADHDGNTLVL